MNSILPPWDFYFCRRSGWVTKGHRFIQNTEDETFFLFFQYMWGVRCGSQLKQRFSAPKKSRRRLDLHPAAKMRYFLCP
jgi:hypothetical protein